MTSESDKLNEQIMSEMRKRFTETVIDHARNPRNLGTLADPDSCAVITGPCGDTMVICLKVKENRILEAAFMTDGCGTTIAAGSMATELAKGKPLVEAYRISQEDILNALGGLPEDSRHCALLAANTLKEAIKEYWSTKNQPWKKAYLKK
jgi:nitrogen fixation NifU-like protein